MLDGNNGVPNPEGFVELGNKLLGEAKHLRQERGRRLYSTFSQRLKKDLFAAYKTEFADGDTTDQQVEEAFVKQWGTLLKQVEEIFTSGDYEEGSLQATWNQFNQFYNPSNIKESLEQWIERIRETLPEV